MERFYALGRGLQLMLVGAVLLLVDLFLTWQDYDVGDIGKFNGWHGFGGVLLGLLTIVLLAWLIVRLAAVDIEIPVSATLIAAFLGFLIVIVAVLKNLVDDQSTFWSYVGVALAILIAVGAWMQVQATGGVESLKSELPSMPSASPASTQAAPPPAAPPPAPAAPAPEPPAAPQPAGEPRATEAPPAESDAAGEPPATEGAPTEPAAGPDDEGKRPA